MHIENTIVIKLLILFMIVFIPIFILFNYSKARGEVSVSSNNVEAIQNVIPNEKPNKINNETKFLHKDMSMDFKKKEQETEKAYTDYELELLACAIYSEGGGDLVSDDTRLKIGCVIMNRVEHESYPNTILEVLTQKGQYGRFYWTGIVWPKRASNKYEENAVQRAYDIAERVLKGERLLDPDYIFQSEHKQSGDYIYQDGLYFCRYAK